MLKSDFQPDSLRLRGLYASPNHSRIWVSLTHGHELRLRFEPEQMRCGAGEGFVAPPVAIDVVGEVVQLRRVRGEPPHRASQAGLAGELILGPDGEIRMSGGQGLQGADGMRFDGASHLAEDEGGGDEAYYHACG